MRIIHADDHAMFREGLRPFLLSLAPEVTITEFGDLDSVLAWLDAVELPPDLVILDLHMPGMAESVSVAQLRQRLPAGVPLAVLSGDADRDSVVRAMAAGATGYISKRASGASLVNALRLLLSGESYVPPTILQEQPSPAAPHASPWRRPTALTPRERGILALLAEGLPNRAIAQRLEVSEMTVKSHLGSAFRKLGVSNRVQAIRCFADMAEAG
jgi:DNA-binding NarL/FixJ family response regulator